MAGAVCPACSNLFLSSGGCAAGGDSGKKSNRKLIEMRCFSMQFRENAVWNYNNVRLPHGQANNADNCLKAPYVK
jgi:hypothetical protein